jgi:serine/threonine-protein kinase
VVAGGTVIDERYEVEQMLGRGGMADVVRARDDAAGRPVAVKVLRLDESPGPQGRGPAG